ncbi:MAG TPA: hypothetical protein VF310_13660 [Vicinamibacteria bacterium]
MPDYDVLCLPLFFATAWLRSNRALGTSLSYNLPLALRWRFPCIRWFWLCELVLSIAALVIYSPLAGMSGRLFPPSGASFLGIEAATGVSYLSYPIAAMALGFLWPQISSFSISLGPARQVSLGAVRDYLLGGPVTRSINSRVQAEVTAYVGRVLDSLDGADDASHAQLAEALDLAVALPLTPQAREALHEALMKRAGTDFEALYLLVGQVKNVPLMDRRRPLMKVEDMSSPEEQRLYDAGIETVGQLVRQAGRGVQGFTAERLSELQRNARRLMAHRLRVGMSLGAIVVAVIGLGLRSRQLYVPDHTPRAGEPVKIGSAAVDTDGAAGGGR